ncbi:MAG: Ldh family oxidoreductase [Gammaproteobacteria bacterium]|nr:MAG: Ldh family oxidoreductase [Gammaproteobacteria bacterium]
MMDQSGIRSKLELDDERVFIAVEEIVALVASIFENIGCSALVAREVAEHLADSNLCGMESHGLMRTLQYAEQFETGYMRADAEAEIKTSERGATIVDGNGGIGIPAMRIATEEACRQAREQGVSSLAIVNVGHTGRLGAFTEAAAYDGFLSICFGGGGREKWRQVAPYGGRRAMLPTNPYSIAIPGGDRGPMMFDFATSKIAGGWIYAASSAGARLPDNVLMDRDGNVSRDPEDYFRGGAILPSGGHKGYALALAAELVAEAMLGPTRTEGGWLLLTVDTTRYREASAMQAIAEEILDELRNCPPAPGFERVEIPGEREREYREASRDDGIALPARTLQQIRELSDRLNAAKPA